MFKILVVEDEPMLADIVVCEIEHAGYSVVGPEGSVESALRALDRLHVDLAVLDVTLGQQTVFPVAAILAAKGIPFILLTGHSRSFLPQEYRDRPVVTKPYEQAEIIAQIMRALEGRQAAWGEPS